MSPIRVQLVASFRFLHRTSRTGQSTPQASQAATGGNYSIPAHDWLSNPSFSASLLPEDKPLPSLYDKKEKDDEKRDGVFKEKVQKYVSSDENLLRSDNSDQKKESRRRKKRRKEGTERKPNEGKKKKHKRRNNEAEIGSLAGLDVERKATVKTWVGVSGNLPKEYFFDTRGDKDNLAFGSLYALDIARYRRNLTTLVAPTFGGRKQSESVRGGRILDVDDPNFFPEKVKGGKNRYWAGKHLNIEKSKDFKRLNVKVHLLGKDTKGDACGDSWGDYVSLDDDGPKPTRVETKGTGLGPDDESDGQEEGESWEEHLRRRTKELNEKTRDRPMDASVWMEFANFQDENVRYGAKSASLQHAVERKISIYEKALLHLPDNTDLQVAYLEACRLRDETGVLQSKWENALRRNPGSYVLWHEYVHWRQAQFTSFSVPVMREVFSRAIQALVGERNRKRREVQSRREDFASSKQVAEAESAVVEMFLEACRFEWQCGHHEMSIGMMQAEMEYAVFAPHLQVSESSKRRLFEEFWDGRLPRVGEEGAHGWSALIELQEEMLLKAQKGDEVEEEEEKTGGWTGWMDKVQSSELAEEEEVGKESIKQAKEDNMEEEGVRELDLEKITKDDTEENAKEDTDSQDSKDDTEASGDEDEGDDFALLEQLGLTSTSGKETEVKNEAVWRRWAEEEKRRDKEQWLPVRPPPGKTSKSLTRTTQQDPEGHLEPDDEVELERVVLFEDVREILFSLDCEQTKILLLESCIDFCDGPLLPWQSTNERRYREKVESQEWGVCSALSHAQVAISHFRIEVEEQELSTANNNAKEIMSELVEGSSWLSETQRAAFVRNILKVAVKYYPEIKAFREALVNAEGMSSEDDGTAEKNSSSRAVAKNMLKSRRQDLPLWGIYACLEAAVGNISSARKVFDTALASLAALVAVNNDAAQDGVHLFLTYAELELSHMPTTEKNSSSSDRFWAAVNSPESLAHIRALHILSSFGEGGTFQPLPPGYTGTVASTKMLKARKCFKEMLVVTRQSTLRGELESSGAAIIAAAALFERLTSGTDSAAEIFEDALAMSLPDKRRRNLHYELLVLRYVDMLENSNPPVKPSRIRHVLLRALGDYPNNSKLLESYVRLESRTAFMNRLRRYFDGMALRHPSTTLWLFSVATEVGRQGSGSRIRSLMEHSVQRSATWQSVVIWRAYITYELSVEKNTDAARRIFFRAIHTCPWAKSLWMDAFTKLNTVLTAKEQSDLADIMREKDLHLRTDVFEILLQDAEEDSGVQ